jgi:hypothetical protein
LIRIGASNSQQTSAACTAEGTASSSKNKDAATSAIVTAAAVNLNGPADAAIGASNSQQTSANSTAEGTSIFIASVIQESEGDVLINDMDEEQGSQGDNKSQTEVIPQEQSPSVR